ncbi:hypothetical protein EJB05_42882, partial [Eragrostis curvula]
DAVFVRVRSNGESGPVIRLWITAVPSSLQLHPAPPLPSLSPLQPVSAACGRRPSRPCPEWWPPLLAATGAHIRFAIIALLTWFWIHNINLPFRPLGRFRPLMIKGYQRSVQRIVMERYLGIPVSEQQMKKKIGEQSSHNNLSV